MPINLPTKFFQFSTLVRINIGQIHLNIKQFNKKTLHDYTCVYKQNTRMQPFVLKACKMLTKAIKYLWLNTTSGQVVDRPASRAVAILEGIRQFLFSVQYLVREKYLQILHLSLDSFFPQIQTMLQLQIFHTSDHLVQ